MLQRTLGLTTSSLGVLGLTCLLAFFYGSRAATAQTPPAAPSSTAPPSSAPGEKTHFPEGADPRVAIAEALAAATKENQRVLIVWGGDWCGWSTELAELLKEDRAVAREILYEYRLVLVNIGRFDSHLDLAKSYGVDIAGGSAPYLTVLAPPAAGESSPRVIANSDGRIIAGAEATDPTAVQMWLTASRAKPLDANAVFRAALTAAEREEKRVFLLFSAPW